MDTTTYRYTERPALTVTRTPAAHDMGLCQIHLDGRQIGTAQVVRTTARTQHYGVTLSNGRVLDRTFASVRKAAFAAADWTDE